LVPGRGSCSKQGNRVDCLHEWLPQPTSKLTKTGLREVKVGCTDDDPVCDFGASSDDQACTFRVALCFNVTERRFACSKQGVAAVDLSRHFKAGEDMQELANALAGLGGTVERRCAAPFGKRGAPCVTDADCDSAAGAGDGACAVSHVLFTPPLDAPDTCTDFALIRVPLRQTRFGSARSKRLLRITVIPSDGGPSALRRPDRDVLRLVCMPR
jgi:hypothetical protein